MINSRQLRYFVGYTLTFFAVPLALLLSGCVSIKPIDPTNYLTPGPEPRAFDEATYNFAVEEWRHKRNRERWYAFGCDVVTTIACVATGRGAELGGNVLIPVKFGVGYLVQKRVNALDDAGNPVPLRIVSTGHLAACVANIITCRL